MQKASTARWLQRTAAVRTMSARSEDLPLRWWPACLTRTGAFLTISGLSSCFSVILVRDGNQRVMPETVIPHHRKLTGKQVCPLVEQKMPCVCKTESVAGLHKVH